MTTFTKGELVVFRETFRATDGSTTQPTTVNAYVYYTNDSNVVTTDIVPATMDATTKIWSATWDTERAKGNTQVYWAMKGTGSLQGAKQGDFFIKANAANT